MRNRITLLLWLLAGTAFSQEAAVDFRFAPSDYQTIICLPDDWQKTLLSEQGALTYDYGPGPYARPLTVISVGMKGAALPVRRQYLENPRIPVVTTLFGNGSADMRQEAFALAPERSWVSARPQGTKKVRRLGGINGCIGWAAPPTGTDPALRNVTWGANRPIRYAVQVEPGSNKTVAIGLCESYKPAPRTRLIELRVEGAPPMTVDPMRDSVKNTPYVYLFRGQDLNRDGVLAVEAHASPKGPDPNVIMNAFWVFAEDVPVTAEAVVRGELSSKAEVYHSYEDELDELASSTRVDGILASFAGEQARPVITVRTRREMRWTEAGELHGSGKFILFSHPRALSAVRNADGWTLELPEGTRSAEVIIVHGPRPRDIPPLPRAIEKARSYWLAHPLIPKNKIAVPDSGIQYLLDASVRTIYQVRDVVEGRIQLQPGPTVYRGIWAADALLTNIAIMSLGDSATARGFLESVLQLQLPNGQIRSLYPSVSLPETPIVLTALCIYARSYGERAWLRDRWQSVVRGMEWVEQVHRSTLQDPSTRYWGLMPPGFVDGGISGESADYGSVWWAMVSFEKAIETAKWIGHTEHVARWESLLQNLTAAFRKSAARDLMTDRFGNTYLPALLGDTSRALPQRGQHTFLYPYPYGQFFHEPDSLMRSIIVGNLAMLDSAQEQGLVVSSGWVADGIWAWLGGLHGIAHDLAGNPGRAAELLYAFANHATPTGTWVEEQVIQAKGGKGTGGDVSDAEASAVFLYHARRLLVRERAGNLELLAGLPDAWLKPGSRTKLDKVFSEFGRLSLDVSVSADGSRAEIRLSPVHGRGSKGAPILYLEKLKQLGFRQYGGQPLPDRVTGRWGKELRVTCVR